MSFAINTETLLLQDMTSQQQIAFANEMNQVRKSPRAAFWWAFCLGGIGAQHYYLGNIGRAIAYTLFFWSFVPAIVSFVELFSITKTVHTMNEQNAQQIAMRVKALLPIRPAAAA